MVAVHENPVIWVVIQARLGSARLPRKVLADIQGKTMLERVVQRAQQIGYPVCVAVCDPELALYCAEHGWPYVEGSEEDVLGRYLEAARVLDADHVVRVTADCPFLDVEAAQWTVQHHLETGADLTTYHLAEGRGIEVFTRAALERAAEEAWSEFDRDSPDTYILNHSDRFRVEYMKFSVDTPRDLELARRRAMANTGFDATRGITAPNVGGKHSGTDRAFDGSFTSEGSSGNPGLENPWEGADATPKPGELPPLKNL